RLLAIDALPRGTRLAIAHPESLFHVTPIPEVHFALMAIARRDAFVPALFTIQGQQPVALKPAFIALAEAAQPEVLWAALTGGSALDRRRLPVPLGEFDFVVFVDKRPIRVPSNSCLAPFFLQPTFQIFAIVHNLECAGPEG